MSKKKIAALATIAILSSLGYSALYSSNKNIEKTTQSLKTIGIYPPSLPEPQTNFVSLFFKNIALDPDEISTIEKLIITHNLFQNFKTLDIGGLYLVGEYYEKPDLSGLDMSGFPYNLTELPFETINLRDSRLSLLTNHFGGISAFFDLQAVQKRNGYEVQSRFKTDQKPLSFAGTSTGFIGENSWSIEGEIERGKFDLPQFHAKATRISGQFKLTESKETPYTLVSEISAGGAQILDLPWQNLSGTLETSTDHIKIFANANSLSDSPVELNLTIEKNSHGNSKISGTLFADNYDILEAFLKEHGKAHLLKTEQTNLEKVTLGFGLRPDQITNGIAVAIQGINKETSELYRSQYRLTQAEIKLGD